MAIILKRGKIQLSRTHFKNYKAQSIKSRKETRIRYPAILDKITQGSKRCSSNPKTLAVS